LLKSNLNPFSICLTWQTFWQTFLRLFDSLFNFRLYHHKRVWVSQIGFDIFDRRPKTDTLISRMINAYHCQHPANKISDVVVRERMPSLKARSWSAVSASGWKPSFFRMSSRLLCWKGHTSVPVTLLSDDYWIFETGSRLQTVDQVKNTIDCVVITSYQQF